MMNKMAAYAKKQQGDRDIAAQEQRANVAIANQEAVMDQQRKSTNVTNALDASKFGDLEAENLHLKFVRDSLKEEIFRLDNRVKPKPRKRRKKA